jgi:hypothetical protein
LIAIWALLPISGLGLRKKDSTLEQIAYSMKAMIVFPIVYFLIIFFIKTSILFCYLRIGRNPGLNLVPVLSLHLAVERRFESRCKITIAVLTVLTIISIMSLSMQCIPIHKAWDITGLVEGKCIDVKAFYYSKQVLEVILYSLNLQSLAVSAFHIITDVWIIALPVKTLMSIQRPNREKFGLVAIFGLGIFSFGASIGRLCSFRVFADSKDKQYDGLMMVVWTMIETNVGIYCASIPALKAIFIQTQGGTPASGYNYRYGSQSTARGGSRNPSLSAVHVSGQELAMKPLRYDSVSQSPGQVANTGFEMDLSSMRSGSEGKSVHIIEPDAEKKT